jgi:hypothetical protein
MDPDTKRWIFDITAWIAGLLAIIMLIADAAQRATAWRC